MLVEYKTILNEDGSVWDKQADMDLLLARNQLTPCCDKIRDCIQVRQIIFDGWGDIYGVCAHFNLDWSEGGGDRVLIYFCPFCGAPMVINETKRTRRVNRPVTKSVDTFIEEDIPIEEA